MFSSQIYCVTFVNHRCTGGFTYFALHFIHATFCIEPRNTRRLLQNKYAHQLDSKAEKIATNELDQKFIEQATQVVEDNMENPEFSVDTFSREMGVGRTVLFQKIKGITGSTPNNFIMNLRLKKAAYFLLNAPEMNISDIAYRLGFGNPQYFNKCFKELFDIAPTQYRKSHDAPSDPSVK